MSELEMHEAGAEAMAAGPGLEKVEETEEHWDAAISRSIDAKREAEESLLQSLVRGMRHLEMELKAERKARMKMEAQIRARNLEDDAQLAGLTKTVDTLLFNLQGYESSAIAREDDNEAERTIQAKRRSLEKKRLLQMKKELEQKEMMLAENAETIEHMKGENTANFQKKEHKKYMEGQRQQLVKESSQEESQTDGKSEEVSKNAETPGTPPATPKPASDEPEEDEETRAARAKAQKAAELQSQKIKKEREDRERRKSMAELKEANDHYSAAIIQAAFRR